VLSKWENYTTYVAETKSYKILSNERPAYLNDDEWEILRKKAEGLVEENFLKDLRKAYEGEKLLLIAKIKCPTHMSDSTWKELQESLNSRFMEVKQREVRLTGCDELAKVLSEKAPEGIQSETWKKYLEYVREKYVYEIGRMLHLSDNPCELLEKQELSHIPKEEVEHLASTAYRLALEQIPDLYEPNEAVKFLKESKPGWMKEADYAEYQKTAQKTVELERVSREYREKTELLEKEHDDLSSKIKKITSQLDIVNQVLNDPTALERIEEYNNPFAPGNFENLKTVGRILRESMETKK